MRLDLLATVVDDTIRFVTEKGKETSPNMKHKSDNVTIDMERKKQEQLLENNMRTKIR